MVSETADVGTGVEVQAKAPARSTRPFSTFERMVALRYLRPRRKEAFISVIAIFSFIGIMLGVATLIIVMAVMNGFRKELLDKILGLNGHLLIQPIESPLTDWQAVAERVSKIEGIQLAAPIVEGQALASSPFQAAGVLVRGIRSQDLTNLASIAIERFLGDLGYQLGRDFRGHHHNSENNALLAAARSQGDAVAASRAVVQRLPAEIRGKLRVVGSTPAAISMLILASPGMPPERLNALRGALARFPYSEPGLRYIEQSGAYLFPVTGELVRSIDAEMAFARGRFVEASP